MGFSYSVLFENNQMVGIYATLAQARRFAKEYDEKRIIRFKNNKDGSVTIFPKKFKEFKA